MALKVRFHLEEIAAKQVVLAQVGCLIDFVSTIHSSSVAVTEWANRIAPCLSSIGPVTESSTRFQILTI
jgi:hypothetical protein